MTIEYVFMERFSTFNGPTAGRWGQFLVNKYGFRSARRAGVLGAGLVCDSGFRCEFSVLRSPGFAASFFDRRGQFHCGKMKPIILHNHEIRILGVVGAVICKYRYD